MRGGLERKVETRGNGLGIFGAYDPVVESMLLECEVEALRLLEAGAAVAYTVPSPLAGEGQDEGEKMAKELKSAYICHPHPGPVLVSAAFERYWIGSSAVGRGSPNARLFAFVPSRERAKKREVA